MIVVFDTNIWKKNLYLKSSASAAVKFFLQRHAAKVGLPEVIRLEVERHLRIDLRAMRERITKDHNCLLGLFDTLPEVVLPADGDIETLVSGIFSQSGFDLLDIPFSERSARSSFLRTIDKTPPSHKIEQFKDGVIWEDCKQLAESQDIILVTDDHAFYKDGDVPKGLATPLAEEAKQCRYLLRVFARLPDLLREIRVPININDSLLTKAVLAFFQQYIDPLLGPAGFAQGHDWQFEKTLYATGQASSLYVDFVAQVGCEDISNEGRTNAVLRIEGDGRYEVLGEIFSDLRPRELSIAYVTAEELGVRPCGWTV